MKRYGHEKASIFQASERWGDPADHRIRRPIRSRSRAVPSDHRIRRPGRRGDGPVRLGDGSPVALGADLEPFGPEAPENKRSSHAGLRLGDGSPVALEVDEALEDLEPRPKKLQKSVWLVYLVEV